jgi:hypothetical protein
MTICLVKFPVWRGKSNVRRPFFAWASGNQLAWYQAYNAAKHDRHNEFEQANLENLLLAISGLIALLSSQFYTEDFHTVNYLVADYTDQYGFIPAIGEYLLVKYPQWPDSDRYAFDWEKLKKDSDPVWDFAILIIFTVFKVGCNLPCGRHRRRSGSRCGRSRA